MKALILPGGGTKIAGILGAIEAVKDHGFNPSLIAGLSAGAILTPIAAIGLEDEAAHELNGLKISDFFSQPPLTKKGKISLGAILNIACGDYHLGTMNGQFIKKISKVITPTAWNQIEENLTLCFIQTVNMMTGAIELVKLNHLSYEDGLLQIMASASIPIFSEGLWNNGDLIMDGGVRSHNPSRKVLEWDSKHSGNGLIDEIISIYSRPINLAGSIDRSWQPFNMLNVAERALEIMMLEISKRDAEYERAVCEARGIKLTQIFLDLPKEGFYGTSFLDESYDEGYKQASKVFEPDALAPEVESVKLQNY